VCVLGAPAYSKIRKENKADKEELSFYHDIKNRRKRTCEQRDEQYNFRVYIFLERGLYFQTYLFLKIIIYLNETW
jgi:hypothetical protein